ncbi:hypothetical protein A988_18929 [Pseudomonas syringae BRIP39023]|nr:hypothetical protein A988_18929 [Pseudomonas syringae BRIP39023]
MSGISQSERVARELSGQTPSWLSAIHTSCGSELAREEASQPALTTAFEAMQIAVPVTPTIHMALVPML